MSHEVNHVAISLDCVLSLSDNVQVQRRAAHSKTSLTSLTTRFHSSFRLSVELQSIYLYVLVFWHSLKRFAWISQVTLSAKILCSQDHHNAINISSVCSGRMRKKKISQQHKQTSSYEMNSTRILRFWFGSVQFSSSMRSANNRRQWIKKGRKRKLWRNNTFHMVCILLVLMICVAIVSFLFYSATFAHILMRLQCVSRENNMELWLLSLFRNRCIYYDRNNDSKWYRVIKHFRKT